MAAGRPDAFPFAFSSSLLKTETASSSAVDLTAAVLRTTAVASAPLLISLSGIVLRWIDFATRHVCTL
uniref:Uncharacterized protein n=1 Tax=Oryza sativa subsp. japonica TaxID=39947 RepID=Q6Z857_ORYSJ|nr:hypothetical protein [Oryza sativa Japonica Group]